MIFDLKPDTDMVILTGTSAAGRGTLSAYLKLISKGRFETTVSMSTRAPRPGEVDGVHYKFRTQAEFFRACAEGELVEWERVYKGKYAINDKWYGTPWSEIRRLRRKRKILLFDVDVKGAKRLKEKFPNAVTIFVKAPNLKVLEERMRARKSDSEESILQRMRRARWELTRQPLFDHILENKTLDFTQNALVNILHEYGIHLSV